MTFKEKVSALVESEWEDFTKVNNRGGRADCQDDKFTFTLTRTSQFRCWTEAMVDSYREDLAAAKVEGRNLPAEKYARMMQKTAPEEFAALRHLLREPSEEAERWIDKIVAAHVEWFRVYAAAYPCLAGGNRNEQEDVGSLGGTSFKTYLWGELHTYSERTLRLYAAYVDTLHAENKNLSIMIMTEQMRFYGFASLNEAEERLREDRTDLDLRKP